jgi:hypothetical protein
LNGLRHNLHCAQKNATVFRKIFKLGRGDVFNAKAAGGEGRRAVSARIEQKRRVQRFELAAFLRVFAAANGKFSAKTS